MTGKKQLTMEKVERSMYLAIFRPRACWNMIRLRVAWNRSLNVDQSSLHLNDSHHLFSFAPYHTPSSTMIYTSLNPFGPFLESLLYFEMYSNSLIRMPHGCTLLLSCSSQLLSVRRSGATVPAFQSRVLAALHLFIHYAAMHGTPPGPNIRWAPPWYTGSTFLVGRQEMSHVRGRVREDNKGQVRCGCSDVGRQRRQRGTRRPRPGSPQPAHPSWKQPGQRRRLRQSASSGCILAASSHLYRIRTAGLGPFCHIVASLQPARGLKQPVRGPKAGPRPARGAQQPARGRQQPAPGAAIGRRAKSIRRFH